jgi:hypothetical protein
VALVFVRVICWGGGAAPPQFTGRKATVLPLGQPASVPAVPSPLNVRLVRLDPQIGLVTVIVEVALTGVVLLVGTNVATPEASVASSAPRVIVPAAGSPLRVTVGSEGVPMVNVAGALPTFVIKRGSGVDADPTSLETKP